MEVYKEEKRKVKRCIYQSKNEINEQFEDIDGNKKFFWNVSKVNGGTGKSYSRKRSEMGGWHWERMKYKGLISGSM